MEMSKKIKQKEDNEKKIKVRKKKVLKSISRRLKSCLKAQLVEKERLAIKKTEHLRRSKSASKANALVKFKGSSSQYRGVSWEKRLKKWKANIKHQGKKVHIGMYCDELEAAKAYDAKAKELHGIKAKLNFPDDC